MARITVEDCLDNVENRFALVHLTASRVRQLQRGSRRIIPSKNKDVVQALREIAASQILPQRAPAEQQDESSLKVEIPG
jgi:DNA-directed RNA polymerase subunit omega